MVNWCYVCQINGEIVDHLLIECDVAYALWGRCLGFSGSCRGMLLLCYLVGKIGLANKVQIFGTWCQLVQCGSFKGAE